MSKAFPAVCITAYGQVYLHRRPQALVILYKAKAAYSKDHHRLCDKDDLEARGIEALTAGSAEEIFLLEYYTQTLSSTYQAATNIQKQAVSRLNVDFSSIFAMRRLQYRI